MINPFKRLSTRRQKFIFLGGVACSVTGIAAIVKDYLTRNVNYGKATAYRSAELLDGKVFVVTGTTSGIGEELAYELALRRAKVFMACRDMEKCEAVRESIVLRTLNKFVYCRKCDLASLQSVRDFADQLKNQDKVTAINGLVNNAGLMYGPRKFTDDCFEIHWATNHLGPFLLTHLLTDLLQAGGKATGVPSRILFLINLEFRKATLDFDDLNSQVKYGKADAFNKSQLATMLTMNKLASVLDDSLVTTAAVYPGPCITKIRRHMSIERSKILGLIIRPYARLFSRSAKQGAHVVLHALLDTKFCLSSGQLLGSMIEIPIDDVARDSASADRLYAIDKYWTGLESDKHKLATAIG